MTIENSYRNEKKGANKFLALKYFQFTIIDTKPIMDLVHELQVLVSKLSELVINISDSLQKGHFIWDCGFKNFGNKTNFGSVSTNSANFVEQYMKELVAMIFEMQNSVVAEAHMATATKSSKWWLDFGITIHVYNNKEQFKIYEKREKPEEILMGNNGDAKVICKGIAELNFTRGKKLKLLNVFHVLEMRKNLASTHLLCKNEFKIVLEFEKVIISKNFVFAEKGYSCDAKDEALEKFKELKTLVENQNEKKIKILRSDKGGEYFLDLFSMFCEENGIIHQRMRPYTP
ncbi:wall-associated receptor kinase 2-like protein [Gossypium australe]|uniref:Wall-associated receptor kinase 2-like protein n=1 Tax=Gossypium australe TaxID=47621 RepID=A0A5B6VQU9_9ROSI|nr:wall-associated receptor kinase 2-like protein [Gossypium australe]